MLDTPARSRRPTARSTSARRSRPARAGPRAGGLSRHKPHSIIQQSIPWATGVTPMLVVPVDAAGHGVPAAEEGRAPARHPVGDADQRSIQSARHRHHRRDPVGPTRCIAVDSPTHLFLAGESMTPTHNTAFALGMAAHAPSRWVGRAVLLARDEPSRDHPAHPVGRGAGRQHEDAQRSAGGVDWTKLSHAIGRLAEAPLFIDDDPQTTIMEIARRPAGSSRRKATSPSWWSTTSSS